MAEMVWRAKDIGAVTDFLTAAECDAYVRLSESKGFEEAPITTDRGMLMMKDVRNNDRVMFDDPDRARTLREDFSSSSSAFREKMGAGRAERAAASLPI